MSYSISLIHSPHADKNGLRLIRVQVLINRMKAYAPTIAKVATDQFSGSKVVNHPKQTKLNAAITSQVSGIEDRLLDATRKDTNISKSKLAEVVKNKKGNLNISVVTYADGLQEGLKGKLSVGRLKHYRVVATKISDYDPKITFGDISIPWLKKFEAHLRQAGIGVNTLSSNMSIVRSILNKASEDGLVDTKQYEFFKFPCEEETEPVYSEEGEIAALYRLVASLGEGSRKLAGYYFLLSCYAGYRIHDSKGFDYDKSVRGGQIVVRTTKKKKIVSIPIHTRLRAILDYIKDKPILITEEHMRLFVKELCGLAWIRKEVKFHTSRHSFAMLLMASGFTVDEVAHLLGDSAAVARVYAKIHNPTLNAKVMDLLG